MKNLIFSLSLFFSMLCFAHEGHDNSSLKSQYGGIIKRSSSYYIELVQEGAANQIYIMDHNYKISREKGLLVSVEIVSKSGKKKQNLFYKKDFFEFVPELKNENHFKVIISLKNKDKLENVEFNLETSNN
jgi:hypothetical protein